MQAKVVINSVDFSGLVAREGITQTEIRRQSRTVVTLDGTEQRTYIPKRQFNISFLEMPEARLQQLAAAITQPSTVEILDRELGLITRSFWVEGLTNVNKIVEGDTTYMNGVSLTMVEV